MPGQRKLIVTLVCVAAGLFAAMFGKLDANLTVILTTGISAYNIANWGVHVARKNDAMAP